MPGRFVMDHSILTIDKKKNPGDLLYDQKEPQITQERDLIVVIYPTLITIREWIRP